MGSDGPRDTPGHLSNGRDTGVLLLLRKRIEFAREITSNRLHRDLLSTCIYGFLKPDSASLAGVGQKI